jgi:hypothetical protein
LGAAFFAFFGAAFLAGFLLDFFEDAIMLNLISSRLLEIRMKINN